MINEKYYGRIEMVRMIQKHTIIKDNIDCHYANSVCVAARAFYILFSNLFMYISRDGKNKIKVGTPNELLAMTNKSRKIIVPKHAKFAAADHDMGKKSLLVPSVMGLYSCPTNKSPSLTNHYKIEALVKL